MAFHCEPVLERLVKVSKLNLRLSLKTEPLRLKLLPSTRRKHRGEQGMFVQVPLLEIVGVQPYFTGLLVSAHVYIIDVLQYAAHLIEVIDIRPASKKKLDHVGIRHP